MVVFTCSSCSLFLKLCGRGRCWWPGSPGQSLSPPHALPSMSLPVSLLPPVITSSSTRKYTVTEPTRDGAAPAGIHTYQWRQTITFQECVHDSSRLAPPSTQQLSVDSVFVLYNQEERILRYALSNSIGPVRGERWPLGLALWVCLHISTSVSVLRDVLVLSLPLNKKRMVQECLLTEKKNHLVICGC